MAIDTEATNVEAVIVSISDSGAVRVDTHTTHPRVVQESWAPRSRRGRAMAHGELVMEAGAPPWAGGRFTGVDTGPGV